VATVIAKNISDECPGCIDCDPEMFLALPSVRERLQNEYSHAAFVISTSHEVVGKRDYSDCLTIRNRYVSFLVIREVKEEDVGDWSLSVVSAFNAAKTGIYDLHVSHKPIETTIEELENLRLISGENGYRVCNATYSINFETNLHWKIQHTEKSVLSTNHTVVGEGEDLASDPVDLPAQQISDLCKEFGPRLDEENVAFSVNYAPDRLLQFNSGEYDGALVQRQLLLLVMCNVGRDQIGTYTCIAPANGNTARREQSMDVTVFARETLGSTQVNQGAIIAMTIVALVIIVVIFLLICFGVRRYRQLKYEAMQMRPMSIPLTQLTNAINHAFASFSPIGSPMYDKFEFQRENLMMLEVIGEGQFGQVWRAKAIGICSEDSRNIVAVKTLKGVLPFPLSLSLCLFSLSPVFLSFTHRTTRGPQ
jgi:hypothetical protein